MKTSLLLSVLTFVMCMSCSKSTTISLAGNWTGNYFANNISYGTWNITIEDNGSITGKIIAAPGFPPAEYYVSGRANANGFAAFTAALSPTIEWRFEGMFSKTAAYGGWITNSLPGNPPNKIWKGNKQ